MLRCWFTILLLLVEFIGLERMNSELRVLVSAGGTGGDLFPAVAVVEQLQMLTGNKCKAVFVGNPRRIEATVVPQLGYEFHGLSIEGWKGVRNIQSYKLPFTILDSYATVRRVASTLHPHVALCAGTYISYPLGLWAKRNKVPLVLIESNAIPGKANRQLADKASLIVAAFEECKEYISQSAAQHVVVCGNPIRQSFETLPTMADARRFWGLDENKTTLLVFGGSLGAASINSVVERMIPELVEKGIQVIWQTGKQYKAPLALPAGVIVQPFIDTMAEAYAAANVVVCRSGGGTVAELGVVGKPAILVPYPHAANNEQEFNARALQRNGAAIMIKDGDVASSLPKTLISLLLDVNTQENMAKASAALGKPRAATTAAENILRLVSFAR